MDIQKQFNNCIKKNDFKKVKTLIDKVDPSANENWAICVASELGYSKIVKLLLKDKRVNPADNSNYAIRFAII